MPGERRVSNSIRIRCRAQKVYIPTTDREIWSMSLEFDPLGLCSIQFNRALRLMVKPYLIPDGGCFQGGQSVAAGGEIFTLEHQLRLFRNDHDWVQICRW